MDCGDVDFLHSHHRIESALSSCAPLPTSSLRLLSRSRRVTDRHRGTTVAKRIPAEITPELVELFRAALPAEEALSYDASHNRRRMTDEQHLAACATLAAFDRAAGVRPWEGGLLEEAPDEQW